MRSSSFNRAALLASAAAQVGLAHPVHAQIQLGQARSGDVIARLLLGARGPPSSTGEVISALLVDGRQPSYSLQRASVGRANAVSGGDRQAFAPAPPRAPARPSAGDSIGALLLADAAAKPAAAPRPRRAGAPPPPTSNFPAPDPQTLLLLLVQLDSLTLSEGLAAYGAADDPLLPVGELSRLLELDVDVSPTDGRVTGRIGEARRALTIDLATNTARIGPVEVRLKPGDVAVEPGDIFVRAGVLSQLLPLTFDVDGRGLQMRISATELLPIQSRLQRLARLRQGAPGPVAQEVMRIEQPYRLISPPSFDVALDVGAQTDAPKYPTRYDIRMGADLLFAGLQAYVGSDDFGRANNARVLLEKRSVEGDLLGPLHARVVGLGDIFTPGLAIGPRSLGGRGFALSTVPIDQTSVFNRVDLRGPLPLGSDIELYVNDVLQGAQQQGVNGLYEFLNVPLTQGVNVVRIVTYGPRGQRNEETRVINAGGGLLRPGQMTLELGAADQNEPLFQFQRFDPLAIDRTYGRRRIVGNINYGLTQYITGSLGGALYSDNLGVERQLVTGGLRTTVAGFATQFDLAGDDRGGRGASIGVAGKVFGANAIFRHSEYRGGLLDENNAEADITRPLTRRTELTVDENIRFAGRIVPITLRALRDAYVDGGDSWIGQVRGSATAGGILYSTGLEYDRNTAANGRVSDILRGALGVSTYRNYEWQVRGNINYDVVPELRASDIQILVDRNISNTWSLRFGATERLVQPRGLELLAGSTTKTKFGDLAITGQYDTVDSSWRLAAQMNFGIGYNPQAGYQITRSGPGSGGSVSFHAFLDANGNGRFDPGEKPVANVSLEGGELRAHTDAEGRAYLSGFGAGPTARLLIGLAGIENQSVRAPPSLVEFSPRPGGVTEIEYPLRPTGEVMVSVKLRRPDQPPVGLSATRLRLVDDKGLAFEGVTEFDGSVNFQDVPVGTYRLELDKEQAQRLRMRLAAPVSVTIRPDGAFTPDVAAEVLFEAREGADANPPS